MENNNIIEILSYGAEHQHSFTPERAEGESRAPFYIGTELEVEGAHSNTQEELRDIKNSLPCVISGDGSLGYYGIEIVSEPLSFKRWKELEPNVRELLERMGNQYGYKSHDTRTCGLHIHVTRPSEDVINRIIFIMETYKEQFIKFARRGSNNYAQWLSDSLYSSDSLKSLDFIKNNNIATRGDTRYRALNLTNTKTIEFRIFKGTLNPTTFMASIELINNLVTLCKDLNRPLSRITWNLLTQGENCKKYIKERGIKTNIVPRDMSIEYLRQYNRDRKKVAKIIKVLNNEILKQTSLFQLEIKSTTPPLNQSLTDEQFKHNMTEYVNNISRKTQDLTSRVNASKVAIQELKNELDDQRHSANWLKSNIKYYVLERSEYFTSNAIDEIKEIINYSEEE